MFLAGGNRTAVVTVLSQVCGCLPACVYVCTTCAQCPWRPEEGVRIPWDCGYRWLCGCWELNSGLLQRASALNGWAITLTSSIVVLQLGCWPVKSEGAVCFPV